MSLSRAKPPLVLMVEDETILRASMARGLRAQGEMDVAEAGTLSDGLALIDAGGIEAVICDIDLPDRSGLELVGELARRSLSVPVLFVTAYLKAYRPQIPRHARVDVLEKPVPLADLRARVRTMLGTPPGPTSPFTVADYVQIACLGRRSVLIEVESGDEEGEVYIVAGDLWSARDSRGEGAAAFKRLGFLNGAVTCVSLEGSPPPRNVDDSYEALLLDAAREQDEKSRDAGFLEPPRKATPQPDNSPVPTPTPPQPTPPSDEEAFSDAWDRGITALMRKDFASAATAFLAARQLRPDDPRVFANLKRLYDMGHLPAGTV